MPRPGEQRQMPVTGLDVPPMRLVEGDDRQRAGWEFMREIAQIRALAAAGKFKREFMQARIVADHHDMRLAVRRGVKLGEQRRDGGVVKRVVIDGLGLGWPLPGGQNQRLPRACRVGTEDEIGNEALSRDERAHARSGLLPTYGQWAIEVVEQRIGPGGFCVAEERNGKCQF